MSRHTPLATTGTGKGSAKRKAADDAAYRENLAKIKFEKSDEPLPFKLKVNGKEI